MDHERVAVARRPYRDCLRSRGAGEGERIGARTAVSAGVDPFADRPEDGVVSALAEALVGSQAPFEAVVVVSAAQVVIVGAAVEEVVAAAAVELVVAVFAVEGVAAVAAIELVVAGAAVEEVVAAAADEEVRARVAVERGDTRAHAGELVGADAAAQLGMGHDAALDFDDVVPSAGIDRHDLADPGVLLRSPECRDIDGLIAGTAADMADDERLGVVGGELAPFVCIGADVQVEDPVAHTGSAVAGQD